MGFVKRIYVEKKAPFAVKAKELKEDLVGYLGMSQITDVRELIRYDVENVSDEVFEKACKTVFSGTYPKSTESNTTSPFTSVYVNVPS